jgi:hypothetical protein
MVRRVFSTLKICDLRPYGNATRTLRPAVRRNLCENVPTTIARTMRELPGSWQLGHNHP